MKKFLLHLIVLTLMNLAVLKQQKMMERHWNVNVLVIKFLNAVINAKKFVNLIALKCTILILKKAILLIVKKKLLRRFFVDVKLKWIADFQLINILKKKDVLQKNNLS